MWFDDTENAECVDCGRSIDQGGKYCYQCRSDRGRRTEISHRPERKYYKGQRGCVVCQRSNCVCRKVGS